METETSVIVLHKIMALATQNQQPLRIVQNPRYVSQQKGLATTGTDPIYPWIASIGNVDVGFNSFYPGDMVDLYAELKAGIEAEETYKKAHDAGWQSAKEAYAKGP